MKGWFCVNVFDNDEIQQRVIYVCYSGFIQK